MRDLIGRTLGHYRIVEKIGEGGMGEVYRAHDERLDRDVAVKVLPEEVAQSTDRLARFKREAKAVAKLNHPNILAIHDFGTEEGVAFAVTELLKGSNLRERIPPRGMDWQKVTEIGGEVAKGLAAAHGKGVVHRDLKPENIFLTTDGQVKILDFGLAQVKEPIEEDAETATLTPAGTVPGSVMGTMGYMSPEQLRGQPVDARSDIFTLGCVLYEMLSGQQAFKRGSTAEIHAAILKEDPPSLSTSGFALPGELERTIRRCLEKTPEARFQSASDLAYDLKSISTDQVFPAAVPKRATKKVIILGATAVAVIAALVVLLFSGKLGSNQTSPGQPAIRSIAILPLQNLTGDPEQNFFVDGLHEELIATFARISAFDKVIARTSVLAYRDSGTPIRKIGEELGVELVVEGSVRRSGNTVRTSLQLINARSQNHLWANSFESDLTDILVLQSDVARAVANQVELALTPEDEARLSSTRTVNPEAHEAYLKGLYHCLKVTPTDLDTAERYFELALEKDPSYAPAFRGLAYVWVFRQQMGLVPPHEAGPKAEEAALRAIALDDESAGAHEVLAAIKLWIDWDWSGAEMELLRALELNPNGPLLHGTYSQLLAFVGRTAEALAHSERALEVDPVNAFLHALNAAVLCFDRRYEDALAAADTALAIQPDNPVAHFYSLVAASNTNHHSQAFVTLKKLLNLNYPEITDDEAIEQAWAQDGLTGAMRRAATIMATRVSTSRFLPADTAIFYAMAQENDEALEWLERAFETRDPNMPYIALPIFDPMRSDPRFQDLLRRLNLPGG